MRHRKKTNRLGRNTSHRKATLMNLARALLMNERIKTTKLKAKYARILAERLITIGKENTHSNRRLAFSIVPDKNVVKQLFAEIAPRFKNRAGGYTRIIPLNFRRGDGADMVFLELTEKKPIVEKPKAKLKKAGVKEKPAPKAKPQDREAPKKTEEKPPEPPKTPPKHKPSLADEKARERARAEKDKVRKGFLRGLRGFFRKSP